MVQILTTRTCAKTSSASRSFLETLLASILSPQTATLMRWHNLDDGHPGGGHDDGDDHNGELLLIIKMVVVMVIMIMEMVIMLILNMAMLTIATAFITLM